MKEKIQQLRHLFGIDVDCTNVKMCAFVGRSLHQTSIPSGDDFSQKDLIDAISKYYNSFNYPFDGIGIAFSGCTSNGLEVSSTSLKCLEGLNVHSFKHLDCENIRFINDANAATLAGTIEYPDSKVLIGVTNGTGIGCGIAINGKLFTGANGLAGEIYGNPTIGPDGNIIKNGKISSGSKLLKKLNQSNEIEKEKIIEQAAQYLGIEIVSLIHSYNPDVIYLSGGGFAFPSYKEILIDFINKYTYPAFLIGLKIVQSTEPSYAGCFGAMKYVR